MSERIRQTNSEQAEAKALIDFIRQYCEDQNYFPQAMEFCPSELTLDGSDRPAGWLMVDGAQIDESLRYRLSDLSSLVFWAQIAMGFVAETPRFHFVVFPRSATQGESKISGGDNLALDRKGRSFAVTVVGTSIDEGRGYFFSNRERAARFGHEMTHSLVLGSLIREGGMDLGRQHPNHLHPLLDEGLALLTEATILGSHNQSASAVFKHPEFLSLFLRSPLIFNAALCYQYRFGLTLSQEEIYNRGFSGKYLAFLEGIQRGTIDLLEPGWVRAFNYRRRAWNDSEGKIKPPFVDQDLIITMSYRVGYALVWALANESMKQGEPPLKWVGWLLMAVQKQYSYQGGRLDLWPLIKRRFPDLEKEALNQEMIRLLRGATSFVAEVMGDPEPDSYLDRYLQAYRAYQHRRGKKTRALHRQLSQEEFILRRQTLIQRTRPELEKRILAWQEKEGYPSGIVPSFCWFND